MKEIAIIGLGAMGSRMAARLVEAGRSLLVCSRRRDAAADLEAAGATWVATPREAAAGSEVVVTMVTDDEASRAVWAHPETGALAGLREGSTAIESSTLTPAWVETLAGAAGRAGASFLAAPVLGSRPQAEAGQLLYLVGGDAAVVERVRPLLEIMGGTVRHTGDVASAMAIKLAANTLFATQVVAWAEALGALRRAGIEPATAAELLGATPVASPAAKGAAAGIVAGRFEPSFPIDLVHKDLGYFVEAAVTAGASVPTAEAVRDAYARARDAGHGGANITGVAQVLG